MIPQNHFFFTFFFCFLYVKYKVEWKIFSQKCDTTQNSECRQLHLNTFFGGNVKMLTTYKLYVTAERYTWTKAFCLSQRKTVSVSKQWSSRNVINDSFCWKMKETSFLICMRALPLLTNGNC